MFFFHTLEVMYLVSWFLTILESHLKNITGYDFSIYIFFLQLMANKWEQFIKIFMTDRVNLKKNLCMKRASINLREKLLSELIQCSFTGPLNCPFSSFFYTGKFKITISNDLHHWWTMTKTICLSLVIFGLEFFHCSKVTKNLFSYFSFQLIFWINWLFF